MKAGSKACRQMVPSGTDCRAVTSCPFTFMRHAYARAAAPSTCVATGTGTLMSDKQAAGYCCAHHDSSRQIILPSTLPPAPESEQLPPHRAGMGISYQENARKNEDKLTRSAKITKKPPSIPDLTLVWTQADIMLSPGTKPWQKASR